MSYDGVKGNLIVQIVLDNIKVTVELRGRVSIFFNIQHIVRPHRELYPEDGQKGEDKSNETTV
jgi:hypothetical protein